MTVPVILVIIQEYEQLRQVRLDRSGTETLVCKVWWWWLHQTLWVIILQLTFAFPSKWFRPIFGFVYNLSDCWTTSTCSFIWIYSSNGPMLPDREHPFAVHGVLIPYRTRAVKLKINPKLHVSFRVWVWRHSYLLVSSHLHFGVF